jgi:hypothetical protein
MSSAKKARQAGGTRRCFWEANAGPLRPRHWIRHCPDRACNIIRLALGGRSQRPAREAEGLGPQLSKVPKGGRRAERQTLSGEYAPWMAPQEGITLRCEVAVRTIGQEKAPAWWRKSNRGKGFSMRRRGLCSGADMPDYRFLCLESRRWRTLCSPARIGRARRVGHPSTARPSGFEARLPRNILSISERPLATSLW